MMPFNGRRGVYCRLRSVTQPGGGAGGGGGEENFIPRRYMTELSFDIVNEPWRGRYHLLLLAVSHNPSQSGEKFYRDIIPTRSI